MDCGYCVRWRSQGNFPRLKYAACTIYNNIYVPWERQLFSNNPQVIIDDRKAQSFIIFTSDELPIKWNFLVICSCEKNRAMFNLVLQGNLRTALHAGEYVYARTSNTQRLMSCFLEFSFSMRLGTCAIIHSSMASSDRSVDLYTAGTAIGKD
jgi:hypothetical protein